VVIHHFNRLIKNKWVWGVFAVAISFFFAFDFLLTGDRGGDGRAPAGKLGGEDVKASDFDAYASDARGRGRRSSDLSNVAVNRMAWEGLAAARVAEQLGLVATEDDVRDAILHNNAFADKSGRFNQMAYQYLLRENGMTPEMFEAAEQRRITLAKLRWVVSGSGDFVSPAELDQAINDVTDTFTVRIASFKDAKSADVKLDDAGLKAYYDENTNSIALPDCVSVKYAAFPADDPAYLKSFVIAEDEMHDRYDSDLARWEVKKGTNGTETIAFEKVKDQLERELQLIAALEAMKTNLLFRAYPVDAVAATNAGSRLDKIAAEEKRAVKTSPLFSVDGGKYVAGFMSRPSAFLPGVDGFLEAVAEIDPESEDLRYGVVAGTNAVYLVEIAKRVPAHVPSFEEAKGVIRGDALADAQRKAFKAEVEKVRALAAAALAKKDAAFDAKIFGDANVSTSITFSVMSGRGGFDDSQYVMMPAMKLAAGQISEFVPTASDRRGLLVYVEKREPGDAAQATMVRDRLRDELASLPANALGAEWSKWNLARMGVQATESTSMEESADDGEVSED